MADSFDPPDPPTPWDRLGLLFGDLTDMGRTMADRNMALWSDVSANLRTRPYKMDNWSDDAARGVQAAMANVQDAVEFVMRIPDRERVAGVVPTAFMLCKYSREGGNESWIPPEPVRMALPRPVDDPPPWAVVDLDDRDAFGVQLLLQRLRAQRGPTGEEYFLIYTSVPVPSAGEQDAGQPVEPTQALVPGSYTGSVYIPSPVLQLANLRIVVEGPPNSG